MNPEPRPAKKDVPNPFLTLGAVVIVLALAVISIKTTLLPRSYAIGLAISFVLLFRWLSRRSALSIRARREREMDELRRTPILRLDD